MASKKPCSLDSQIFIEINILGKIGLTRVKAIESQFSAHGTCCNSPLKKLVLKGSLKGSTPLLLACADGNLVVVKRIVERWGVDVRAAATYYYRLFHPITMRWNQPIERATPLFVAALNGHDPVVRYLVDKGAEISVKTAFSNGRYSGMTPLYAALTTIHLGYNPERRVASPLREKKTAAVRFLLHSGADPSALPQNNEPPWMTPLCNSNVTTITQLINHGMSLVQRDPSNGKTVLHQWAGCNLDIAPTRRTRTTEEGSPLSVVKLLVEKGADPMALDNDGFTPIMGAALAFFIIGIRQNFDIFEFLLQNEAVNRSEKIDAMELIGAAILFSGSEDLFPIAFDYWRRALHLREEGSEPIIKIAMKWKSGLAVEWITSAELEHVIEHPSDYLIQSFLIGLRICSSKSNRAVFTFLDEFIPRLSHRMISMRKTIEVLNLLWAALEMILTIKSQEAGSTWSTSASVVQEVVEILRHIQKEDPQLLKTDYFKTSLELILSLEHLYVLSNIQHRGTKADLSTLLELFKLLASRPDLLNQEIKELLAKLVQLERPAGTLLHPACEDFVAYTNLAAAYRAMIPLLLMYGVDPSTGDSDGNGPLHIVLAQYSNDTAIHEERVAIARLLLDKGAHLDRVNNERKTAVDVWTESKNRFWRVPKLNCLPDWCYESIPKLICLSARVIRSHKIFYKAETLPITLHKFVEMH